ncbi:MAG: hypothetical protein AAF682_02075 [Planctomycetota bacterium]
MKLALAALPLFASLAAAQSVDVVSAERRTEVGAYGFDFEFDDGLLLNESSPDVAGPWSSDLVGDLDDYYGIDVADAQATVDSTLSGTELSADLDVVASTTGSLFISDSGGTAAYRADFNVTSQVRYVFTASVQSTYGYNESYATLAFEDAELFGVDASYGAKDSLLTFGWFHPGAYTLDATAIGSAGLSGGADLQSASTSFELQILHAADSNLDGIVTFNDAVLFVEFLLGGSLLADFNGDGALTIEDWEDYVAAWLTAGA